MLAGVAGTTGHVNSKGSTVHAATRPLLNAGTAIAAASLVAVAPIAPSVAPKLSGLHISSRAMRLVAEDSLFNVPLNLFYDFVNIPYYELQAADFLSRSLFFSGPWFVVSATNLWGVDPGDPSHFQSVANFLFPNPELSGIDAPETDFEAGFGQQLWGMVAAVLPISSACDATDCLPVSPTSPITGISALDWMLWLPKILAGQEKFPLFENWFQVSFGQLLNGYYFDPGLDGSTDPSGPVYPGFGFPGTGPGDAVPWSGLTYTLDPLKPIENYFDSLMAPPATDGVLGTGIYLPDFEEVGRTLQALAASSVLAFDPLTPGSPFCPGDCSIITDLHLDYPDLVKAIGDAWPGNARIDEWLTAYANGTANVPTPEQILNSINILQQPFWDFGNPSPPDDWNLGGIDLSSWAPYFHDLWTSLGFNVPPLADASAGADVLAAAPDIGTLSADLVNPADWADLLNPANWL